MTRVRRATAVGAVVVALAGCGGVGPGAPPTLHGVPVADLTCPDPTTLGAGGARAALPGAAALDEGGVTAFVLCPQDDGLGSPPVTVTRGTPAFGPLMLALESPDTPPDPDGACDASATVEQYLVAVTAHGPYRVSIPVDGCGHYQPLTLQALSLVRGT